MQQALLPALLASALMLGVAAPRDARAQPPASLPPAPLPPTLLQGTALAPARGAGWVIQPGHWITVGAGIVAGVVVTEVLVPTRLIYVLGGIAGGYLASTWYDGRQVEIRTVP